MKHLSKIYKQKGFTLIELLIVIVIIATLAVTVFVALNPAQRIKDAKDARRTSDVDTILSAVHAYIIDNKGSPPTGLEASTPIKQIGSDTSGCNGTVGSFCTIALLQAACIKLGGSGNILEKYLQANPIDPDGTAGKTKYAVEVDANGIVTVTACATEGTTVIKASR